LDKQIIENFQETSNFIWQIADEILRDDFRRGKYPDVILPFTVLRRLLRVYKILMVSLEKRRVSCFITSRSMTFPLQVRLVLRLLNQAQPSPLLYG
jgi:hypothetical protein